MDVNPKNATVDCTGLEPGAVFAAIYNANFPGGKDITAQQADEIIEEAPDLDFDYVNARCIKTSFGKYPTLYPWAWDRDNGGDGAMAMIVARLHRLASRQTGGDPGGRVFE